MNILPTCQSWKGVTLDMVRDFDIGRPTSNSLKLVQISHLCLRILLGPANLHWLIILQDLQKKEWSSSRSGKWGRKVIYVLLRFRTLKCSNFSKEVLGDFLQGIILEEQHSHLRTSNQLTRQPRNLVVQKWNPCERILKLLRHFIQ